MKYTFLAIAPCNFTVNGQHFSAEAGTPITVDYDKAVIMSSPTFRFRSFLRVITPIEKPVESSPSIKDEPVKKKDEPELKVELELTPEPVVELAPESSPELKLEPKPKRTRKKESSPFTLELNEESINHTAVINESLF